MFRFFGSKTGTWGSRSTAQQVATANAASIKDRVYFVTGANTGIGLEAARTLAASGGKVILGCRSLEKGQKAMDEIRKSAPSAEVSLLELDLASFASIRKCVDEFHALQKPLHVLVNNAGVMACPKSSTADGIELQFGTNHVGHFLLTNLLLDDLKTSGSAESPSRIVVLASGAHKACYKEGLYLDNVNLDNGVYHMWKAYGRSKLSNILFTRELARRLEASGDAERVKVNCLHPGVIQTELWRHFNRVGAAIVGVFASPFLKSVAQGAATTVFVASDPSVTESGLYYKDCHVETPSEMAQDTELGKQLWEASEKLTSSEQLPTA